MRVFQAAGDQIGLRVQYEKYNLIDDSRTVNTQFSTLDEALECVDGYQNVAERQSCPQTPETAPAEGVRGIVFSRPRMR